MPRLLFPGPFEPSLQFRYTIFSSKMKGLIWYARSAQQPTVENGALELHHGNSSFYVKGKTKWNPITLRCYQFEGITLLNFWQYLLDHQYVPDAKDKKAPTYKHDMRVSILGPEEFPMATWVLYGAFFEAVNFGDMDRGNDEVIEIDVTIRYDYAEWKPFSGGGFDQILPGIGI